MSVTVNLKHEKTEDELLRIEARKRRRKIKQQEKKQRGYKLPLAICCVIFAVYAFSLLYPMVWIFLKSFQDPVEFKFEANQFFPSTIFFGNYERMLQEFDFLPMISNTIILSLLTPALQIAAMCCISYAYAKFQFKGKAIVYFIAISSMFIPSVGTLAALYELMMNFGLMDTIPGYILLCGNGMGFGFLLVSSQYENVSKEYSEAAEIDGASRLRIFAQIVTPLIFPTVISLWVLSFIGCWNDYAMPYLFLPTHPTLSVGIKTLNFIAEQSGGTDYPVLFAGIIMVEIPVLIIFFVFQKRILSFSLGGGIKG